MKRALVIAFCLLAACTDRSLSVSRGPFEGVDINDPILPTSDFATPTVDLSAAGQGSNPCSAVLTCAAQCDSSTPMCQAACIASGSPMAAMGFEAIIQCGYDVCTNPLGDAPPACASNTDTSSSCISCVTTIAQGQACAAPLQACLGGA